MRREHVHDLAPLREATKDRPHAVVLAEPRPSINTLIELADTQTVQRFEVIGHAEIDSPAGPLPAVLVAPAISPLRLVDGAGGFVDVSTVYRDGVSTTLGNVSLVIAESYGTDS